MPYKENSEIRDSVNYLLGLPFIPLPDIPEVFDMIYENLHNDVLPLWDYIDDTYVRGRPTRGRRQATAPDFAPPIWNCYESAINKEHRTTNIVEGWHSKFQNIIQTKHANIWKFLDTVRKEQNDNDKLMVQMMGAGHTRVKNPVGANNLAKQRQLETMVRNYGSYKQQGITLSYLKGNFEKSF